MKKLAIIALLCIAYLGTLAQLETRPQVTDPSTGKFHVVKAGNGVPNYSYYILWEDMAAAMDEDNPNVVIIVSEAANLPINVPVGTQAYVQDEESMYVYDVSEVWINTSSAASDHNELSGLDGGEVGYYWHLTTAEHSRVSNWRDSVKSAITYGDPYQLAFTNSSGDDLDYSNNLSYDPSGNMYISSAYGLLVAASSTNNFVSGATFYSTTSSTGYGIAANGSLADIYAFGSGVFKTLERTDTPPIPYAGYGNFYFKDDGRFYAQNSAGDEYDLTADLSLGSPYELAITNGNSTDLQYITHLKWDATNNLLDVRGIAADYLYNTDADEVAYIPNSSNPVFGIKYVLGFTGLATSPATTSPGYVHFNSTEERWKGDTGNGVKKFLMEGDAAADVDADDVEILDVGAYYISTNVEGALQEVGDSIDELRADIGAGGGSDTLWTDYPTYNFVVADNNRAVYSGDTGSAIYIKDNDETEAGTGIVGIDYDDEDTEFIKLDGLNSEVTINQSVFMPDLELSDDSFVFITQDTTDGKIGRLSVGIDTTLSYTIDTLRSMTTFNSKTDNYTLVLADAGKTIKVTAATDKTITIPLNSSVAYPVGTYINISSLGAGTVTVAITATGTLTSNNDNVDIIEDGMVTVLKYDTNSWQLFGGLE